MKGMKPTLTVLVAIALAACNWLQPHEYVAVLVINDTNEPVIVETGLDLVTVTVSSGVQQTVSIVKGVTVEATGKHTGTLYGSRTFYHDATWTIV